MANIHINRDRRSLGQFSPEDVTAGLQTGKFFPTDLAWTEGMESWKPLSEFPGLAEVRPPLPTEAPGSVPLPEAALTEPAWERRSELGFMPAMITTIKGVLGQPADTFARMVQSGGLVAPLIFYTIVGWVTGAVAIGYQLAVTWVNPSSIAADPAMADFSPAIYSMIMAGVAIFLPVLLVLAAFISAAVTHVCLLLVGGAKKPFETTFRVVCYSAATSVFQLVPVCGGIIYTVYNLVVLIIGIQKAHEIELPRAIIAVLLPLLLCCGIVLVAIAIGGAASMTAIMEQLGK